MRYAIRWFKCKLKPPKKGRSTSRDSKQTKPAKRARTLSESRSNNYRITPPATTSTQTLRSGLQPIDYLSLNDGYEMTLNQA